GWPFCLSCLFCLSCFTLALQLHGRSRATRARSISTESGSTESGSTESGSTESGSTESGSTESGSTESGSTESGKISPDQSRPAFIQRRPVLDARRGSARELQQLPHVRPGPAGPARLCRFLKPELGLVAHAGSPPARVAQFADDLRRGRSAPAAS